MATSHQPYQPEELSCSIVIRCFNEVDHIGRLLHGVMLQTVKDVEIIVVDSGSTDGTLNVAKRFPVTLVELPPEEFSFGHSLNLGCEAASGDIILIASAHVYPVYKDWIEKLLSPFNDSSIGIVYGQQRGDKNTRFSEHQVFAKWFPEKSNLNQAHPFCNNANSAIRRGLWLEFPYDEELTGLEDLHWARRIMKAGFHVAYQAGAVVIHAHDETSRQTYNRYRREAIALKQILPEEEFKFGDFTRLFLQNSFSDMRHALYNGMGGRAMGDILKFRFSQFWGTYRGFKESGTITSALKHKFYYPNNFNWQSFEALKESNNPLRIDYRTGERSYRGIH